MKASLQINYLPRLTDSGVIASIHCGGQLVAVEICDTWEIAFAWALDNSAALIEHEGGQ